MPKTKSKKRAARTKDVANTALSFDGVYLLKLVLYLLVGSLWVKVTSAGHVNIPIPIGLLIGLIFTTHEHFQIDRKIEYAVLIIAMLFGFFAPYGLYMAF